MTERVEREGWAPLKNAAAVPPKSRCAAGLAALGCSSYALVQGQDISHFILGGGPGLPPPLFSGKRLKSKMHRILHFPNF